MSLRQIIITLIGVGILGYLALFLIQTAPHDPEVWHKDPFLTYAQRTENLKFPDYISIKVIELGENRSTIAIYSRSRYGYGDMGVNKDRVLRWLETLSSFIETEPPSEEATEEASSDN